MNTEELRARVAELEMMCAETYQVVSVLAYDADRFGTCDATLKVLDNLSAMKRVHTDVLPFESGKQVAALEAENAALKADAELAKPAVPSGYALVPVEPTWDMKMAASSNYREPRDGHYTARMECAADAYRAMLAAAPSPFISDSLAQPKDKP